MIKFPGKYIFKVLLTLVILLSIPIAVYLVGSRVSFFKYAIGRKADIYVDVANRYEEKEGVWKNLAQGGEAEKEKMLQPIVDKVSLLKPNYIRIDHIYDNYDVVGRAQSGELTFNWERLDGLVSDILLTGAKPFFSISYMPGALSSGGSETDFPRDWSEWELLVQKTIEHYSGLNGLAIENVYYEVWNEPDLFGDVKTYGDKNYLELYGYSAAAAQRVKNVNNFKIGGPATTGLYKNWVDRLVKFSGVNNLRLDFISWHAYEKDINTIVQDAFNVRVWLGFYEGFYDRELIISEIGLNSEYSEDYDGMFAAIHTIATSAVLENAVNKVFNFEIKDGGGGAKYSGKWGIITNEKYGEPEVKPRYDALLFLNDVKGAGVGLINEGTWVKAIAKIDRNILKILVVNYDPQGKHTEAVPIKLVNLPSGKFMYKRVNFKGQTSQRIVEIQDNVWETLEYFDPNTSAILEIEFLD